MLPNRSFRDSPPYDSVLRLAALTIFVLLILFPYVWNGARFSDLDLTLIAMNGIVFLFTGFTALFTRSRGCHLTLAIAGVIALAVMASPGDPMGRHLAILAYCAVGIGLTILWVLGFAWQWFLRDSEPTARPDA